MNNSNETMKINEREIMKMIMIMVMKMKIVDSKNNERILIIVCEIMANEVIMAKRQCNNE
jgi:hypothetical protein